MSVKSKGPVTRFTDVHLWKAMNELFRADRLGRKRLAHKIGVGEGTTRTIISLLKSKNLIVIKQTGITLTDKGRKRFEPIRLQTARLSRSKITVGKYNFGVLVKNRAHKIKYGIEQRDCAVKSGALGATTIVCKNNRLTIPGTSRLLEKTCPGGAKEIKLKFQFEDNDAVIIGCGKSFQDAEKGAVAAALDILDIKFI